MRVFDSTLKSLIDNEGEHESGPVSSMWVWRLALDLKDARAEIAACKGRLKHHDHALPSLKAAITKAQDEAYERAAQVCDARQNYEPECPETAAYCADAIRAMKPKP